MEGRISASAEELEYRVYHDTITGYYNWNYMWELLLHQLETQELKYAFAHFNIKDMKMVNDIYGHEVANDLLKMICAELENERKKGWILHACRCDNDNFSMLIKVMPEPQIVSHLNRFFEKISRLPANPDYRIYYRCGVVTADDAITGDVRVADYAKFAQNLGRNSLKSEINFFTSDMYRKVLEDKKLVSQMDDAIANDEFFVYYQPKYDVHTEKIVGAEALVRWNYKHEKMIPPGDFIPVFESTNVIGKLDDEVLRKVCVVISKMLIEGLTPVPISVNLSRMRLKNPALKDSIIRMVDSFQIPHNLIEFELTESAAYTDDESMLKLFQGLHEEGFKVSLDDFGTGYSSLSVLRKLPMDTLKIDKSFVDVVSTHGGDTRENLLLSDIIIMVKHLGFKCLAEGAETADQVQFLKNAGCDVIQGYYYSKPLPEADFLEKLRKV